jgi:response regulator of citrate/malate metabolism
MTDAVAAPIRVAILDDHPVVREGTAAIVEGVPDMELVGTAATLEEARPFLDAAVADVVLLDLRLGQEFGFRVFHAGGAILPAIVVVTSYDYPQYVDAALRLGAVGYVLKTAPIEELLTAIRRDRISPGHLAEDRRVAPAPPLRAARRGFPDRARDPCPPRRLAGNASDHLTHVALVERT